MRVEGESPRIGEGWEERQGKVCLDIFFPKMLILGLDKRKDAAKITVGLTQKASGYT